MSKIVPEGWKEVTLNDVASPEKNSIVDGPFGSNLLLSDYDPDGTVPVLTTKIMRNISEVKNSRKITQEKFNELQRSKVLGGDILIAKIGSVGVTCIYPNDYPIALIPANLCKITPNNSVVNTYYLKYWLDSLIFKKFLNTIVKTTAQPAFGITNFKKLPIFLPTLDLQQKIVHKLDYVLGELEEKKRKILKLDDGVNYNQIIKTSKKQFFKLAFNGELTKKWRENNSQIPSAKMLVDDLVEKRKKSYELQLKQAKSNGLRKPKSKFLLELPMSIPQNSELPKSWIVTTVDFLAFVTKLAGFEYTKYFHPTNDGEVPLIRAQNVQMGRFDNSNIKYISRKISDILERSQINGTEILMGFVGAGTGNVCLAPTDQRWHLAPNVAKIDVNGIDKEYLYYFLQSPDGITNVLSRLKTSAQPSLSMTTIRLINVNLPPLEEQKEIILLLKQKLLLINSYEKQIVELLRKKEIFIKNIHHIQSSILNSAFTGKLVN